MKLIDLILKFEDGTETVSSFNEIFVNCQLRNFSDDAIVTIGDCCSPETVRMLSVDGTSFRHNFAPVESEMELQNVL